MERPCPLSVTALTARAHHAAMQHASDTHVLHMHVSACNLLWNVDARHPRADEPIAPNWLLWGSSRKLDVKSLVADQLPVGDGARGLAIDRHHAFRNLQTPRPHAKPCRGNGHKRFAGPRQRS